MNEPRLKTSESGEWKEKPFNELYKVSNERNTDLVGYDKMISVGSMSYLDDYARASKDSLSSYKVMREGDIAFEGHEVNGYNFGRFVGNDIGPGIVSSIFTTMSPMKEMPISFWKQYIHYDPIMREKLAKCTNAGVMMNALVVDDFMKQKILVPALAEQQAIGETLKAMDEMIENARKELERLKQVKKASLSVMFPQEGETKPRVRFKGFTDDWEQRKLGEIVDYSNGVGHEDYVLPEGKYELITLKSINSEGNLVCSDKFINAEFETLKQGTLIMMLSEQAKGMLGMTTIIPCNNRYILNQRVAALNLHDNICGSFLSKEINNKQAYFEQMGAGTKVQNISKGNVESCSIEIPNYEEQKKIGSYFDNLDNLITLHQRELFKLERVKGAMLSQMFAEAD